MKTLNNTVSVAVVIDTSGSMSGSGYAGITKINSKAFVSKAIHGDKIAICNFDRSASVPFPLKLVTDTNDTIDTAVDTINRLTFKGPRTNMRSGIDAGLTQLASETNHRGIVFLSDGYNNQGQDPLGFTKPEYPIFACAMGPRSDQRMLQRMAAKSVNGQYYYAPKPAEMGKIYNQIKGNEPNLHGVTNQLKEMPPNDYLLIPGVISANNKRAQFSVTWTDTNLVYTSGNPSSTKISITLVDPQGNTSSLVPEYIGEGYVVYNLINPQAGRWSAQVLYSDVNKHLPVTVGVFEYPENPNTAIRLETNLAKTMKKGEKLQLEATLKHGKEKIPNANVSFEITRPKISVENALKKYKNQYQNVTIKADSTSETPKDIEKLCMLRAQKLPEYDILPNVTSIHHCVNSSKNIASGTCRWHSF